MKQVFLILNTVTFKVLSVASTADDAAMYLAINTDTIISETYKLKMMECLYENGIAFTSCLNYKIERRDIYECK